MYRTVTYELLSLEAWLATGKRPDRALAGKMKTEVARIREALLTGVLTLTDETHVQRYIRTHHFGIIQLLNKVSGNPKSMEATTSLLELLTVIESTFANHLDPEAELCQLHAQQLAQQCKETISQLSKNFAKTTVSEKLQAVFVNMFRKLTTTHVVTYHQQKFAHELIDDLTWQFANTEPDALEKELTKLTLNRDLNSTRAFYFWRDLIKARMNTAELSSDKREQLLEVQMEIQHTSEKQKGYHINTASLRDQVLDYVSWEMNYLDRSETSVKKSTDRPAENFRVRTELSVSQLACLLKTLVDMRIIVNPNISELLRFFAQTIVSKRAEAISFDSLRAKYYNIESGTKEAIRQTLQSLAKTLS
ncbi:MAG: hypothetical protein HOP30_13955 [Cyclobacteriaceae bacterium]|nr:hypothetical protein [Cyclobacteriaceae bacterium]